MEVSFRNGQSPWFIILLLFLGCINGGLSIWNTKTKGRCVKQADRGPCVQSHPRWYWNIEWRRCAMFSYGGCKGNSNNFKTLQDCRDACRAAATTVRPTDPDYDEDEDYYEVVEEYDTTLAEGEERIPSTRRKIDIGGRKGVTTAGPVQTSTPPDDDPPVYFRIRIIKSDAEEVVVVENSTGTTIGTGSTGRTTPDAGISNISASNAAASSTTVSTNTACGAVELNIATSSTTASNSTVESSTATSNSTVSSKPPVSTVTVPSTAAFTSTVPITTGSTSTVSTNTVPVTTVSITAVPLTTVSTSAVPSTTVSTITVSSTTVSTGYVPTTTTGFSSTASTSTASSTGHKSRFETCTNQPDPGPCKSHVSRWYWSMKFRRCAMFTYGGCEGNSNNFESLQGCRETCFAVGSSRGIFDPDYESDPETTPSLTSATTDTSLLSGRATQLRSQVKHTPTMTAVPARISHKNMAPSKVKTPTPHPHHGNSDDEKIPAKDHSGKGPKIGGKLKKKSKKKGPHVGHHHTHHNNSRNPTHLHSTRPGEDMTAPGVEINYKKAIELMTQRVNSEWKCFMTSSSFLCRNHSSHGTTPVPLGDAKNINKTLAERSSASHVKEIKDQRSVEITTTASEGGESTSGGSIEDSSDATTDDFSASSVGSSATELSGVTTRSKRRIDSSVITSASLESLNYKILGRSSSGVQRWRNPDSSFGQGWFKSGSNWPQRPQTAFKPDYFDDYYYS